MRKREKRESAQLNEKLFYHECKAFVNCVSDMYLKYSLFLGQGNVPFSAEEIFCWGSEEQLADSSWEAAAFQLLFSPRWESASTGFSTYLRACSLKKRLKLDTAGVRNTYSIRNVFWVGIEPTTSHTWQARSTSCAITT